MIDKIVVSPDVAVADIPDGATVLVGGFGYCGVPENLIAAIARRGITGLTTMSDDVGMDGYGLGLLHPSHQIRKMIVGRAVENAEFDRQLMAG